MAAMKAIRTHEYGGPEVIIYEEVPRPEPAADEVLIHVQAAGVNPVDWKIREGFGKEWFGHRLPRTLGCDLAGIVESTGDKVLELKPGEAVYGYVNLARCGAYAEYAIARESEIALSVGALTSWQALFDIAKLTSGQRVLIHAA